MGEKQDVWQGTLALMILKTLETLGPLHGYGIARRIEQTSGDRLSVNYGTIYPALLRLEQEGSIAFDWGVSDNNRRAKFYKLTRAGRRQLELETREWKRTTAVLARFLAPAEVRLVRPLRVLFARVAGLFGRARQERDLADELDSHIQMHVDDAVRAGMTPEAARREAIARLGGIEATQESVRDRRRVPFLETGLRDLRYAARSLRRSPGFAAVTISTLALGIGANTAIFTIVHAVMLRPLPFHEPDRITVVWEENARRPGRPNVVSPANFLRWQERATVFQSMSAFYDFRAGLTGQAEPEELVAQGVTSDFFTTLGSAPLLGRTFAPDEGPEGHDSVTVLSYGLWQRRFGGDPGVIGRTIQLNRRPFTVIGVMPPDVGVFLKNGSLVGKPPELWEPIAFTAENRQPRGRYMSAIARLKPGVRLDEARAQMSADRGEPRPGAARSRHGLGSPPDPDPRGAGGRDAPGSSRARRRRRLRAADRVRERGQPAARPRDLARPRDRGSHRPRRVAGAGPVAAHDRESAAGALRRSARPSACALGRPAARGPRPREPRRARTRALERACPRFHGARLAAHRGGMRPCSGAGGVAPRRPGLAQGGRTPGQHERGHASAPKGLRRVGSRPRRRPARRRRTHAEEPAHAEPREPRVPARGYPDRPRQPPLRAVQGGSGDHAVLPGGHRARRGASGSPGRRRRELSSVRRHGRRHRPHDRRRARSAEGRGARHRGPRLRQRILPRDAHPAAARAPLHRAGAARRRATSSS